MATIGGKGKKKGNKWENEVYDDIRKRHVLVRKNKGSGNAEDNKGDLETNDLLIECKHYKKVTDKMINDWMNKILKEAMPLGKYPLLIVKENYVKPKVYYINGNQELCWIMYDFWLDKALTPDVVKPQVPNYIG